MPTGSFWYTKAVGKFVRNTLDLDGDTFKVGLSSTVHVPNKDDGFLDDVGADDFIDGEDTVTGYTSDFAGSGRKSLVTRTVTDDLTNDRVTLDADDPTTWTTLANFSAALGQATLLREITNDASSPVIINLGFANVSPGGNDFVVQFASTGIGYFQQ